MVMGERREDVVAGLKRVLPNLQGRMTDGRGHVCTFEQFWGTCTALMNECIRLCDGCCTQMRILLYPHSLLHEL
jgi:hypothetical protein